MDSTQQQSESQQMRPSITTNSVDARMGPGRYPKHAFPIAFFPAPIGTVATPHFIQENANNATQCLSRCAGEFESVKNRCQQTTQLCPPRLTSKFSSSCPLEHVLDRRSFILPQCRRLIIFRQVQRPNPFQA